ncbi:unnamed protein product [Hymenolepis diminuta]|uniref:GrpE protein homolog n=1 Tax=Hymenolepis diminuta TaxID=6216 RepID=A0A158QD94_HYMDI|nr:unnamed protein product [Hymenolepis diminuta]
MGIADKTEGVILERGKHHTIGKVIHKTSGVVVYASTQENAINKKLYSTIDVSAAENIGRILAYRCHCIGIISVLFDVVETPLKSTRNKAFHDALLESGIELEEPSVPRPENYGIDYDSLSFEQKKSLYPSLIEELRTTPDWGSNKYPYSLRPVAGSAKNKMKYQVLSKIRQGYIWDRFYNRMVKPEHLAAWQVEQQQIQEGTLGSHPKTLLEPDESPEPYVPDNTETANNDQKPAPENATTASSSLPVDNKQLEELTHENDKLLKERRDFEDRYKRALAEAENVRKRMHRQVEDAKIFGIQSFCKDLLEVADILGKAIEAAPKEQLKEGVNPHFLNLYEGLKMTDAQLLKVFGRHHLHKIAPAVGDTFNPNVHEAMFTVPVSGENKPNTIAVVQKVGYSLHERTLRPAYVGVFTTQ